MELEDKERDEEEKLRENKIIITNWQIVKGKHVRYINPNLTIPSSVSF